MAKNWEHTKHELLVRVHKAIKAQRSGSAKMINYKEPIELDRSLMDAIESYIKSLPTGKQ